MTNPHVLKTLKVRRPAKNVSTVRLSGVVLLLVQQQNTTCGSRLFIKLALLVRISSASALWQQQVFRSL